MIHVVAIILTLAWVALNVYLWHSIKSQEGLLVASAALALVHGVPFWLYVNRR